MTRDEILSLGQQAGWEMPQTWDESDGFLQRLERFTILAIATTRREMGWTLAFREELQTGDSE